MPGGDGDRANDLKERIGSFVEELKKGYHGVAVGRFCCFTTGSCDVAIKTINLLIRIISQIKVSNADELMRHIKNEGRRLQSGDPSENIIGNMIRRILKIIREEYRTLLGQGIDQFDSSDFQTLSQSDDDEDYKQPTPHLTASVIEAITELKTEIEGCVENIAALAQNYVHDKDVILTIGKSKTVEAFLKNAKKAKNAAHEEIKFQVFVSECAPFYQGHKMAKNLADAKINTTLITECQIGTIMPSVTKVIIGTHSFMANGGLKAVTGTNIMAVLAKEHNKHVIVCSSLYKLSPFFHSTPKHPSFNKFASPSEVLDYEDAELLPKVEVIAPIFDYVPPDLVSLVVSNNGAQSVTYVYRLVKDFYHPDDIEL